MDLGDRNTKYFHTKAYGRKKKNTISKLMDDRGIWKESALEVAEVAVSYFEKLYMTSHPEKILEVVEAIDPKVSNEVLEILGPMQDSRHGKYLGLPLLLENQRMKFLQRLKKGWEESWRGGRKNFYL